MEYDCVIVGGGSGGYAAARTAVDEGLRTAVVDGSEELGGLCILRGCMPSKTLIESANRNLGLREAEEFGLRVRVDPPDAGRVQARKRELIGGFASYRREQLEAGKFDLIRGSGAFRDPHTLEVRLRGGGERSIGFRSAIIATGSKVLVPEVPGLAGSGYLTSDGVLQLEEIPGSVIVLGGGAIALEMAHFLDGMGAEVTVVQRSPHVLKSLDPDIAGALEEAFRARGLTVYTGTALKEVRSAAGEKTVVFEMGGEIREVSARSLIAALGRVPQSGGLGLEEAGVETARGRVATDLAQRCSQPHIFAAGDVCGPLEVVHVAIQQGEIAARNAARQLRGEEDFEEIDYRLKMLGIFTEPQVAAVGASEKELAERGVAYRAAAYPFDDHGKSMVLGATEGFVKLLADATSGEILGASVVGPEGVELIHQISSAMHFRATAADLAAMPWYHPTLAEIWSYPAEELAEQMG